MNQHQHHQASDSQPVEDEQPVIGSSAPADPEHRTPAEVGVIFDRVYDGLGGGRGSNGAVDQIAQLVREVKAEQEFDKDALDNSSLDALDSSLKTMAEGVALARGFLREQRETQAQPVTTGTNPKSLVAEPVALVPTPEGNAEDYLGLGNQHIASDDLYQVQVIDRSVVLHRLARSLSDLHMLCSAISDMPFSYGTNHKTLVTAEDLASRFQESAATAPYAALLRALVPADVLINLED